MKKYIGILGLSLILSYSALADTTIPWTKEGCESAKGIWITAHTATDEGCDVNHCNGLNFCKSNTNALDWWNALIWCQAIGHKLADAESACPNAISGNSNCPNLGIPRVSYEFWTSTIASNPQNSYLFTSSAQKPTSYRSTYKTYALCME